MSQTRSLKIGFLLAFSLLVINVALVLIFPNKPPKVIEMSFFNSPINPQVKITFSKQMDKKSILDGGFISTPRIDGDFSWSGNTLFFTPRENLEFGAEYKFQINTTVKSLDGEYLSEVVSKAVKTDDLSIIYLSEDHKLMIYNTSTAISETITPEKYRIEYFDYDPATKQIIFLAGAIYVMNTVDGKITLMKDLNDKRFKIHHIKWLPFENAILLSRSKISNFNADGSIALLSEDPADTELIIYRIKSGKSEEILSGRTLSFEFHPSPDGRQVAYINESGHFVLKNLRNNEERILAAQFNDYFGFSRFGKYALYLTKENYSTYTLRNNLIFQNQEGERLILSFDELDISIKDPVIAPNEKSLAFIRKDGFGVYKLEAGEIEGNEFQVLAESRRNLSTPLFSPDGKILAYLEEDNSGKKILRFYRFEEQDHVAQADISARNFEWVY